MSIEVDKLTNGIGKAIETVPTIYDDLLKPSVQESGKVLSLIPKTINAALIPLRQWIANKEYNLAETEKLLAQKLENVQEYKIISPESYIAVPAIQAISYSMDSKELRNLYANLLAKAMHQDTKDDIHPAFVDIIKQMSPTDANIFKIINTSHCTPLIDLSIKMKDGGNDNHIYNISWINTYNYSTVCISIDNLIRLGLIEIPSGINYLHDCFYYNVRDNEIFINFKNELLSLNKGTITEELKYIKITALGNTFYKMCVLDDFPKQ